VRRLSSEEKFMAILEVYGFNNWLSALLEEYGCREIVLIHPGKRLSTAPGVGADSGLANYFGLTTDCRNSDDQPARFDHEAGQQHSPFHHGATCAARSEEEPLYAGIVSPPRQRLRRRGAASVKRCRRAQGSPHAAARIKIPSGSRRRLENAARQSDHPQLPPHQQNQQRLPPMRKKEPPAGKPKLTYAAMFQKNKVKQIKQQFRPSHKTIGYWLSA
jgi:hypothetical protein